MIDTLFFPSIHLKWKEMAFFIRWIFFRFFRGSRFRLEEPAYILSARVPSIAGGFYMDFSIHCCMEEILPLISYIFQPWVKGFLLTWTSYSIL